MDLLNLLFKVAFRNLWLYRVKTLIVGVLLGFGAFLAVLGLSLLRDIEGSMQESMTGSIAGHLQVYSGSGKDELSLFGGGFMGRADIGELNDIENYRQTVLQNPNVAAFVPMGQDTAFLGRGNVLDEQLDALRSALKNKEPVLIDPLRFQLEQLQKELIEQRKVALDKSENDRSQADLAKALTLNQLNEEQLQFLETKIAPLSGEKTPIYLSYLGTDMDLFQKNFPKFRVVEGQALPAGQRGILLSHKVREDSLKALVARLFDRLNRGGPSIDPQIAKDLPKQTGAIMGSLNREQALALSRQLTEFGIPEGQLKDQLQNFLKVDAENFRSRHDWFYQHIAPLMKLYEISPGDTIILRSYTRSGYMQSLALRVYGVYAFTGLEDSDLAGQTNLMDLVSFRELYGKMTESSRQELAALRQEVGLQDVDAAHAEDQLFGSHRAIEETKTVQKTSAQPLQFKASLADRFDPIEMTRGLALNAAITLKDPHRLEQTKRELEAALKAKGLSARVVDWQKASGMAGQFVGIMRLILLSAIAVIFLVALVIINNSIIVGTLNRLREIGTMRAVGAQKSFVVSLFLAETALTGCIGALVGTALAALLIFSLHRSGIPASHDVLTFLFSGPRLRPTWHWNLGFIVPAAVTLIATLSSVYAARHAAAILPAEAMQEKE